MVGEARVHPLDVVQTGLVLVVVDVVKLFEDVVQVHE